jgi:hypothetical protein
MRDAGRTMKAGGSMSGWKGFTAGLGALLLGAAGALAASPPDRPEWCPSARSAVGAKERALFQSLADKARRGETLVIVAIGSSSTEGSDLPDRTLAYPSQLQRRLDARLGDGSVQVLNKGRGGETMNETVARFGQDVRLEQPDLVIWQLGVNDVVRGADIEGSRQDVEAGMAKLGAVGAPVILMDMQVAPRVVQSPTLGPMRALIRAAALKHDAVLWSRFELMRGIIDEGRAAMTDLVRPDELHMTPAMHACTAAALGDLVASRVLSGQNSEIASSAAAPRR